jgi:succinate-semialdehyde dehydrogenase/glutarate-semialdehyde dehydrogenase
MEEGVNIGPLINNRGVEKVDRRVKDAVSKGATILYGGKRIEHPTSDCFYEPTVPDNVSSDAALSSEETFGPLAALLRFRDEKDVMNRANDTEVGLAGYFYTRDVARTHRVAEAMQVGMVAVNAGIISQPCIPFGGVKQGGFGREGGRSGIDEYMAEKVSLSMLHADP